MARIVKNPANCGFSRLAGLSRIPSIAILTPGGIVDN